MRLVVGKCFFEPGPRGCVRRARRLVVKVPIQALNDQAASSTDATTWTGFEEALAYYQAHRSSVDGIGYAFSAEDPFTGIDLDDARDAETGGLSPGPQRPLRTWTPTPRYHRRAPALSCLQSLGSQARSVGSPSRPARSRCIRNSATSR